MAPVGGLRHLHPLGFCPVVLNPPDLPHTLVYRETDLAKPRFGLPHGPDPKAVGLTGRADRAFSQSRDAALIVVDVAQGHFQGLTWGGQPDRHNEAFTHYLFAHPDGRAVVALTQDAVLHFALPDQLSGAVVPPAPADGPLAPALLDRLKSATAFLKVEAAGGQATGRGFVVAVEGGAAYVATNHHVLHPEGDDAPPGKVTAVFGSGTDQEQVAAATLAAAMPELDLAVVKVTGLARPPAPIDLSFQVQLTETMPVFILGYPLGQRLAVGKGHPAITVGRGTVSSLRRNAEGALVAVQIDGDVNPGNSRGPVVDGKGRLVGLTTARVRDTHIGLALPAGLVAAMIRGRPVGVQFTAQVEGDTCVNLTAAVRLFDPLGRLTEVVLAHGPAAKLTPDGTGAWPALPSAAAVKLRRDGAKAVGTFSIPLKDWATGAQACQIWYKDGNGTLCRSGPQPLALAGAAPMQP